MRTILVTGAAGFIGARTVQMLLEQGERVVGLDNMNDYYDVGLKEHRLKALRGIKGFNFHQCDIEDAAALTRIFKKYRFDAVINLAARAGVRYSMAHPMVYMTTNAGGTLNVLEQCRERGVKKFVLASTSSLYAGQKMPFSEQLPVNTPISPYAASKKAAEAMAYTYHYLYGIDVSVLRYFTVYGPCGRPDMSVFRFIQWIDAGKPLEIFGDGRQSRDFTYVDDIAAGTIKALKPVGFATINLGGDHPYTLNAMIRLIEGCLGKKARFDRKAFHKTDIKATWADISVACKVLKWRPKVRLEEGIQRTVAWHHANRAWVSRIKL